MTRMFRKLALSAVAALALSTGGAMAAGEAEITDYAFSFEGPFGSYDTVQLQRGLKVFTEVCSACHGLNFVAYRTLSDEGGPMLPEEQMRAYAAQYEVETAAGDFVPATPADHFGTSGMENAPDLSLIAKARAGFHGPYGTGLAQLFRGMGGPEYIASLLAGYAPEPDCAPDGIAGLYYNTAFANGAFAESCVDENGHHMVPGSWIAMPQPLYGEDVVFDDGHVNDLESEAQDVAAFLMWAAEPHLDARKHAGLLGVLFLTLLAVLLYLTNKRLWAPHKNRARD
ncbi:MAG: cytochrome c1 [Rubellimicrobium sp.]|nr:cytochrome c1 [Rubellimicrobium sp.]